MKRTILEEYISITREIKDLERRICDAEKRIRKIESGEVIVADVVACGKRGKKNLGTKKVEGAPIGEYNRKLKLIRNYKLQMELSKNRLEEIKTEVEMFIENIDCSRTRRIIRFKYIDGLTWRQVAQRMGGPHTEESCRKTVKRYLESLSDMSAT